MTPLAYTPPRFVICGPDGFVRMVVVVPGRRGAQLERHHVKNIHEALHLCTRDAAQKVIDAIEAHFPLSNVGYKVIDDGD